MLPANPSVNPDGPTWAAYGESWDDQYGDPIGVAVNGVLLFHDHVKVRPNGTISRSKANMDVDSCAGHSDLGHRYHYHVPPTCLIKSQGGRIPDEGAAYLLYDSVAKQVGAWSKLARPSYQIGWMLDGFPLYGPYDRDGRLQLGSSLNATLDECNFDAATQRYHATPNPPYLPPCLVGSRYGTYSNVMGADVCPSGGSINAYCAGAQCAPMTPGSCSDETEIEAPDSAFMNTMLAIAFIGGFFLVNSCFGKTHREKLKSTVRIGTNAARRASSVHAMEVAQASSYSPMLRGNSGPSLEAMKKMVVRRSADGEIIWVRFHPIVITVSGVYSPVILILCFQYLLEWFYPDGVDLDSLNESIGNYLGVVGIIYACTVSQFWATTESRATEIRTALADELSSLHSILLLLSRVTPRGGFSESQIIEATAREAAQEPSLQETHPVRFEMKSAPLLVESVSFAALPDEDSARVAPAPAPAPAPDPDSDPDPAHAATTPALSPIGSNPPTVPTTPAGAGRADNTQQKRVRDSVRQRANSDVLTLLSTYLDNMGDVWANPLSSFSDFQSLETLYDMALALRKALITDETALDDWAGRTVDGIEECINAVRSARYQRAMAERTCLTAYAWCIHHIFATAMFFGINMLVSTSSTLNQTLCSIMVVTVGGCTYLIASTNEPYLYMITPSAYTNLMKKVKRLKLQSNVAAAFAEGTDSADRADRARSSATKAGGTLLSRARHHEGPHNEPRAESMGV